MKGKLYTSHFLTCWTDRVYEFSCFLLIAEVFKTSLLLASIYGFSTTIAAILFSNFVGRLADVTPRLAFVRMTMFVQKGSIVLSCIFFYVIFEFNRHVIFLYSGVVVCGCFLKLAFIANNIAIEKDWVMVITEGDTEGMLTVMKRIDLFCKTMAPIMMGTLMSFGSSMGVIIIGTWNTLSLIVEYQLVLQTYKAHPKLASKDTELGEGTPLMPIEERRVSFLEYVNHQIFPASLAMAMLHMTVLSFGGIMISYLKIIGYQDWSLGVLRAVAGIAGLASTWILPFLSSKIGIIRSGMWAVWFEAGSLTPVVISLTNAYRGSVLGSIMLFAGMCISRVGLWMFDITETILLQQLVDPAQLGSISGWQHSMCNVFDLSQYILTAIVSDPKDFIIPATVSLGAIFCSSMSYTYFVRKERGHLLHWKKGS
ncbi:Ferroporti-1 [Mucor mucedo]|uniref:Ferroporti-1 n=1 Tax=Mucor mucedo TaxID=29922 RepID=UPI00221F8CA7|nr:Ferroporti-1 [Mucor mucedo]KAI7893083.1 Ferroporti-1 [Mucor mucedo]